MPRPDRSGVRLRSPSVGLQSLDPCRQLTDHESELGCDLADYGDDNGSDLGKVLFGHLLRAAHGLVEAVLDVFLLHYPPLVTARQALAST